ncbi:MAG: hypothetical protein K8F91_24730 [Candidatus Obscuribacterales bacterium]|nr:hypothetical protein [Candidatus Obscuribacterales bacterium]
MNRLLFIFISLLLASILLPQKAVAGENVFVLRQLQDKTGDHTLCISKTGLKLVCGQMALISTAPDWNIVVFNRQTRTYFKAPADQLRVPDWITKIPPGPLSEAGDDKSPRIAGLKTNHYKLSANSTGPSDLWTSRAIPLEPNTRRLLRRLYGNPNLNSVPLLITGSSLNGKSIDYLSTQWCQKRGLSDTFYRTPKSYKQVSELDMVAHPDSKSTEAISKIKPFARETKPDETKPDKE